MAFYFQDDFYEAAKLMPVKERRIFLDAIITLYFEGVEIPDMPLMVQLAFVGFRERILMARKQSENAKHPRKPKRSQKLTNEQRNASQTLAGDASDSSETATETEPEATQETANTEPETSQTLETPGESESESESEIKKPPKGVKKRFVPPSVDEVRAYAEESGHPIDAEAFIDHYQSNGWKVGRNTMKDWKATVRNWYRRDNAGKGVQKDDHSRKYAD